MKLHRTFTHSGLSVAVAGVFSLVAFAQSAPAGEWQLTSGPYGGGIVGLGLDGSGSIYGARNDDIFRSDDGGATWINVSTGGIASAILCSYVTPSGDLYAGVSSRGVWWSFDGGASWDHDQITHDPHGGLGASILALIVNSNGIIFAGSFRSPDNGNTWIELGFYGNAFAFDSAENTYAGNTNGVRVSFDEGVTWTPINAGIEGVTVEALGLNSSDHIFAGTRSSGVFLSTDAGASWSGVNQGLPSLGIESLVVDSADRVYAALTDGGLYRSTNSGASWITVESGLTDRTILSLLAGPGDDTYAGSEHHGVFLSTDQGTSWSSRATSGMPLPHLNDLTVSAGTGEVFLAAGGGGVYRSTDEGTNWEERNTGLTTTLADAIAGDSSGRLYAGTADGVYASTDAGASWTAANAGHEGTPVVAILVNSNDELFALARESVLAPFSVLRSVNGGTTWMEVLNDSQVTVPMFIEGWVIDSEDRIFFGGMSVTTETMIVSSADGGETWAEVMFPAGGATGLAVDSMNDLYATMAVNEVHKSTDRGVTWVALPTGDWPTGTYGALHVVGVDDEDAVLVSSRGVGIWRSTDGGSTWITFNDGLPVGDFPVVTFLTTAGGDLFVGTETHGLFRFDGGATSVTSGEVGTSLLELDSWPNPFHLTTAIQYTLPENARIRMAIHDVAGRSVRTFETGTPRAARAAGIHTVAWDGRDDKGLRVTGGIYFVRLKANDLAQVRKVVFLGRK